MLGIFGIAGWLLSLTRLISIVPGYVSMKPNTAFALVLCGAGLVMLSPERGFKATRLIAATIAIFVAGLGFLTLCEYAFAWDPGFDRWLFHDQLNSWDLLRANRMSPATAFCFLLTGSAMFLYSRAFPWWLRMPIVAALAATVAGVAGLGLAGYAVAAMFYGRWWNYAGMAIHTALAFGLIATSLLALVKREGTLTWVLDRTTTAGFVLAAAVMLIASGLSYSCTNRLLDSAKWVSHTQYVLKEIQEVSSGMAELESGQRGFIITDDERLLEQRRTAIAAVSEATGEIRKLTVENVHQQHWLDRLEPLIEQRTAFGNRTLAVRREEGQMAASALIATRVGIDLTTKIAGMLNAMREDEYVLLKESQAASGEASTVAFLVLPLGVFLSLTILSAALLFLNAGVHQRAQAEEALQESEARMACIVNSALDAIVSIDEEQRIVLFNVAAENMFRYPAAEVMGQPLERLIPGRLGGKCRRSQIDPDGSVPEPYGRRANGFEFPLEESLSEVEVSGRRICTVILRDITERKRADQAAALLAAIVESSTDAIVGKDLQGNVTSWNAGAERMFGYPAAEMIGHSITRIIPRDRCEDEARILFRIRRGDRVQHFETVRLRKDASLLEVSVTVSPIKDANGRIVGASKIARDITDRRNAEVALQESERLLHVTDRRLAEIMDGMTEACFALDAGWRFTFVNDRSQEVLHHRREEMLGRTLWEIFGKLSGTPEEGHYRRAMTERTPVSFEVFSPYAERWLDVRLFPTPEGLAAFLLDIHARKLGEVALRDSQARLSSTLAAGSIGTWTWDIASDRLAADEFTARMFSLDVGDAAKGLPAAAYLKAVLKADQPGVADGLAQAIKSCGTYDLEYRVRQQGGEICWLQARGRVDCNEDGVAAHFHGAVMDITHRKRAEGRFRRLVDSNAQGVIFWNIRGEITRANDAFLRIVGYSRDDLLKGHVGWAGITPPEYAEVDRHSREELAASGTCTPYEKEFIRKDGTRVPILLGAATFEDTPDEGVCFVLDITERKEAGATLREAEKEKQMAYEASRLKSEFLANMSHELRTPLNCILGFTEFLVDEKPGPLNAKQKEYLTDVYNSSQHLLQLINDVLDLAKVEAGKIDLTATDFPLRKAIEEVCAVVKGIAQKKNVTVALEVDGGLDSMRLDQPKFKQICYNLLSNAVKFTDSAGRVDIHALASGEDRFEVRVSDGGIGIRPEDIPRLFREFEQLDSGSSRQFEGTGLGLALTKKLVEAQGGVIKVESVYGRGSVFSFCMPRVLPEACSS